MPRLWWRAAEDIAARRIAADPSPIAWTDLELRKHALHLRDIAQDRPLTAMEHAHAAMLVREAARRAHGTALYPHQLQGGLALAKGAAIEMETGEGKTLTALVVAFLWGLTSTGCHVLTANDYLAERDCRHAQPVLERLGVTVDWIGQSATPERRRMAYAADVTYVTVTQVGFDWLRERVATREAAGRRTPRQPIQRPLASAVIDEADLVLLDEARTPLLLAVAEPISAELAGQCAWAAAVSEQLTPSTDYRLDPQHRAAQLTSIGCQRVLLAAEVVEISPLAAEARYRLIERRLEARHLFQCDHDYVVRDQRVAIVAATTGRILEGRQWQNGLQPAIEWQAGVPFSPRTQSQGSVTIQALIGMYPQRCGMSGTLWSDRQELAAIYQLPTRRLAPRLPSRRTGVSPRLFRSRHGQLAAIAQEVERCQRLKRPVLVGTASIETSLALAQVLEERGLLHQVLTAREPEREAEIVALAGLPGQITIATNMAGRGTDIRIDRAVAERGGLHVIVTGWQASRRIDRQLIGRTARQGDPGSDQAFLSYDDELLQQWDPQQARHWQTTCHADRADELARSHLHRFQSVQQTLEQLHRRQRQQLALVQQAQAVWHTTYGLDPYVEHVA
jgi:preprotein translocase subunit SecA